MYRFCETCSVRPRAASLLYMVEGVGEVVAVLGGPIPCEERRKCRKAAEHVTLVTFGRDAFIYKGNMGSYIE